MRVHQITEAAPLIWGAVWIMRMLAAGHKAMPVARTAGEKMIQTLRTDVFKRRLYASPKQAQKLENLSKEASDLKNTITKLKLKKEDPKAAFQARKRLEEIGQEMKDIMIQVAKNKKRDMEMF
jgi:cell division protein FtsB